jgi:hypothetical protein
MRFSALTGSTLKLCNKRTVGGSDLPRLLNQTPFVFKSKGATVDSDKFEGLSFEKNLKKWYLPPVAIGRPLEGDRPTAVKHSLCNLNKGLNN